MIYFSCEDNRRELILQSGQPLNGIDRLEVISRGLPQTQQQRYLQVYFVKPPVNQAPFTLLTALKTGDFSVRIEGGERIRGVQADQAVFKTAENRLEIHVDRRGDFSRYTLALLTADGKKPLAGLDERLAQVDFSFKVECPSDLDCRQVSDCAPAIRSEPELDYLAKDFNSFRQLMLDRLALIAPEWRERNLADLGITLVELMAYAGDYLSYRQDAIATEAYLGTARQRVSVRRHARLLDYRMHEGCNARAWVQIRLKPDAALAAGVVLPRNRSLESSVADQPIAGTCFATGNSDDPILADKAEKLQRLVDETAPEIFEPLHDVFLHPDHNEFTFYPWAARNCCLPKGATKATLTGFWPKLQPGFVLVFQEVLGPLTGNPADADPAKRHAVKLTAVDFGGPTIADARKDALTGTLVTEIEWAQADAMPFPLCLSSQKTDGIHLPNVSVALGNIVLVDHGRTQFLLENMGTVPQPDPFLAIGADNESTHCDRQAPKLRPARFAPRLQQAGLTHCEVPADPALLLLPATQLFRQDLRAGSTLPAIRLFDDKGNTWQPKRDLIDSDSTAQEFVAEIENDGRARIRFGNDDNAQQPSAATTFTARYRIGNGARGNVGAGAITQIYAPTLLQPDTILPWNFLETSAVIQSVSNPMPAQGGLDPETMEEVRQYAPRAFRTPKRCVTPEDYAVRAAQHEDVQRAAATIRWTGSWHTIFLAVDRRGGRPVDENFEEELRSWLESYRLAGHDLEIAGPQYLSLELELFVCVDDNYQRSDVKAALLDAFSTRQRADGSRGFFHPDEFTFGDPVILSRIVATAQNITGVRHLEVRALRRQGSSDQTVPAVFSVGRREIIRLQNDRNFPDHGILILKLKGGR